MRLSEIGEFGLIDNLKDLCKIKKRDLIAGIGDDAAVVKSRSKTFLLASDMLLEGVHFNLSFTTFYQLGYKTLAVNVSDIFAMGGKPKYFLLNLGVPQTCALQDIKEIYRGLNAIAKKFGIAIVGGDTCASKKGLILSGTLIGETGYAIMRQGALPGDGIFVTGALGDSAMGFELLKKTRTKKSEIGTSHITLIKRHLMPEPAPLKSTSGVTSMIDISDGLLIDLSHICDQSNVGAVIYKEMVPLSKELIDVAKKLRKDPLEYALKGGEDYLLLFTSPDKIRKDAVKIGDIVSKGRYLADSKGRRERFKAEGYEHFKNKQTACRFLKDYGFQR
ncbi:MAG: thiamine-phosphate kinase [Nitrospirae bacterium]|nr:thiamine-phosphate kinase [Nitrospirota bacterium]